MYIYSVYIYIVYLLKYLDQLVIPDSANCASAPGRTGPIAPASRTCRTCARLRRGNGPGESAANTLGQPFGRERQPTM